MSRTKLLPLLLVATNALAQTGLKSRINLQTQTQGQLPTSQVAMQPPAAYASGTTYALNALVNDSSGNTFISLQAGNTGNALPSPITTPTAYWALYQKVGGGTGTPAGTPTTYRLPVQVNSGGSTPTLAADNLFGDVPASVAKDAIARIEAANSAFKGPRVSVTNSDFAGGADPTGATDSTAAVLAALAYAQSLGTSAYAPPVLYFPKGTYLISQRIEMSYAANGANGGVSVEGDGTGISVINYTAPTGAFLEYLNEDPAAGGHLHVSNLTVGGSGHTSTQTGIEIDNTQNVDVQHVEIAGMGDAGLKVQDSERCLFDNLELISNRRSIINTGNSNENYYTHLHIISPGLDGSNYSYNVNAALNTSSPGTMPTTGPIYPDYHTAITVFGGQNVHVLWGSLKSVQNQAGVQFMGTNGATTGGLYVEGFGTPSVNPSLQIGGQAPLGRTTAAMTTSSTTVPVDNGIWFPFTYAAASDLSQASPANSTNSYNALLQPPDYNGANTTTLSSICSGVSGCNIYQSTYEIVNVAGGYNLTTSGAATMQMTRGVDGTTAQAWPVGAVLSIPHNGDTGDVVSHDNHYNGPQGLSGSQTNTCSMTPAATTSAWKFTPATVCGEIIDGPIVDGFDEGFLTRPIGPGFDTTQVSKGSNPSAHLVRQHDVMYNLYNPNTNPQNSGVVVIQSNATLTDDQGCTPTTGKTFNVADPTVLYLNSVGCQVAYPIQVDGTPNGTPLDFIYRDLGAGTVVDTLLRNYSQDFEAYNNNTSGQTGKLFRGEYDTRDGFGVTNFRVLGSTYGVTGVELDGGTNNAWNLTLQNTGTAAAPVYVANETLSGNANVAGSITGRVLTGTPVNDPALDYTTTPTPAALGPGVRYVQWAHSAAGTLTLSSPIGQTFPLTLYIPSSAVGTGVLSTPAGSSFFVNGANVGSSWTPPAPQSGVYLLQSDGGNWLVMQQPVNTVQTASGSPTGTCQTGQLYSNTSGAAGSTLFVCVASAWVDVK